MSAELMVVARECGMVVKWFPERGYGFIKGVSGTDYWFHKTWLNEQWSSDRVRGGQVVTFIPSLAAKGCVALDVRLEERAADEVRAQGGDPAQTVEPTGAGQTAEPERLPKPLSQDPASETRRDEGEMNGDEGARVGITVQPEAGLERIRLLAQSDGRLRVVLAVFRELTGDESEITVDELHRRALITGSELRRVDVIAVLRVLQAEGQGIFVPGRWGYKSRFESWRALRSLGEAGA